VLRAPQCQNRDGETMDPFYNVVKGVVYVYTLLLLVAYHALYSMGYDHRIQNGFHDYCGPVKA
jgi:hypothetical protein